MKLAPANLELCFGTLPRMPSWVTSGHGETLEDVAFLSGESIRHLHVVLGKEEVPQTLLREQLALQRHRKATLLQEKRRSKNIQGDLRDAIHPLRPGDLPGLAVRAIGARAAQLSRRCPSRRFIALV
ncbi:MAG: DUF1403 family protein [Sedimentitalea sp.]